MGLGITYPTHSFWEAHGGGRDSGRGAAKKKKKSHINRKAPDTWAKWMYQLDERSWECETRASLCQLKEFRLYPIGSESQCMFLSRDMWYFKINLMFVNGKLWREKRLHSGNLEERDRRLLNLESVPTSHPNQHGAQDRRAASTDGQAVKLN